MVIKATTTVLLAVLLALSACAPVSDTGEAASVQQALTNPPQASVGGGAGSAGVSGSAGVAGTPPLPLPPAPKVPEPTGPCPEFRNNTSIAIGGHGEVWILAGERGK